ncbi:MAG: cytidylyltransferase domain-containing protein [Bacteroidota bacterium]
MYKSNSILAIIPARGGSKGIVGKNLTDLNGHPLIYYTIHEARKCELIDNLIISTDDTDIAKVAYNLGCEVPFIRPKELAKDDSKSIDLVFHALKNIPNKYDYIILLQPTSPFRKLFHIEKSIKYCIDSNKDSLVSVSLSNKHPSQLFSIKNNLINEYPSISEINKNVRRQDLENMYYVNGAIYLVTPSFLEEYGVFYNSNTLLLKMSTIDSVDIDTEEDLLIAKGIMNARK